MALPAEIVSSSLYIEKGNAFVYYAFDVGAAVDITKAEQILSMDRKKTPAQEKRRQAKYFEFTPSPIRLIENIPVTGVGSKFSTSTTVEILIFDFGCVSVRFEIPVDGPVSDAIDLSIELYENVRLKDLAKSVATNLLAKISSVVDRPEIAERIEDYCIFHLSKIRPEIAPSQLLSDHIIPITCLLRAEADRPSDREIQEILSDRISYGSNDVTLMSWYAAVIYGDNAEDIYTVLEFANLVLMELSFLDSRLDKALDEFYDYFTVQNMRNVAFRSKTSQLRRISRLQIDSAISFERITNALKLMGDDFQARVFQLATKKMGLSLWDASITRKLRTIESIYDKISDSEGSRRMEVLEIIVIALIAISIALPVIWPKFFNFH
jgi:hypothetical protein